ncbi:MAG: outer membrane beta-barrel protein [Gammaproteobacteria bacterium]|nr:outer membrane beta-barrel protein [Gammaproteobacteria bacterium]
MRTILLLVFLYFPVLVFSGNTESLSYLHPFYVGVNAGYGSTTWKGLVPNADNKSIVLNMSTPTNVTEGGGVVGGVVGFEFFPSLAIESLYLSYPDARVFFDTSSLFTFENEGLTELRTHTEAAALMVKVMFTIPETAVRLYSSVGAGWVHREDELSDVWLTTPAFGAGFNYPLSEHLMAEIAANYFSGYGESELNPVNDFIPFLYSVYFRVAYRI